MGKSFWISVVLTTIILGICSGILVHVYNDAKLENATIAQIVEINKIAEVSSVEEEKTTPNTEFYFEIFYKNCGHTAMKKIFAEKDDVNKTEKEIKEKYVDWIIKSFSKDKVELCKQEEKTCSNHYLIKENNGKISVYMVDSAGNETLKRDTDIQTKYLPKEDIELLKKGVKANSIIELEEKLSDYE